MVAKGEASFSDTLTEKIVIAVVTTLISAPISSVITSHFQKQSVEESTERGVVRLLAAQIDGLEENLSLEEAVNRVVKENKALQKQIKSYEVELSDKTAVTKDNEELIEQVNSLQQELSKQSIEYVDGAENQSTEPILDKSKEYDYLVGTLTPYSTYADWAYVEYRDAEALEMGGNKYYNSFMLTANYGEDAYAVYNLNGKYSEVEFTVGNLGSEDHVLLVKCDDNTVETITVKGDAIPVTYKIPVKGVYKFELRYNREYWTEPLGFGSPKLYYLT